MAKDTALDFAQAQILGQRSEEVGNRSACPFTVTDFARPNDEQEPVTISQFWGVFRLIIAMMLSIGSETVHREGRLTWVIIRGRGSSITSLGVMAIFVVWEAKPQPIDRVGGAFKAY